MFKPYVRMRPLVCVDVSELDDHVQNLEKIPEGCSIIFRYLKTIWIALMAEEFHSNDLLTKYILSTSLN